MHDLVYLDYKVFYNKKKRDLVAGEEREIMYNNEERGLLQKEKDITTKL